MSEYQYYEFQTIDQPLTKEERNEIGTWSSRTYPTTTQAIFTYSYGDFPQIPEDVVLKYFDAMLYMSNWGSKRLIFRLPSTIVDIEKLQHYCFGDSISVIEKRNYILLDIFFDDEEGSGWIEGEGLLSSFIDLRNDIINNDFRMLYLSWLNAVSFEYNIQEEINDYEPPVPANLNSLSSSLKNFVEFFKIDENLILAGAKASVNKNVENSIDIEKVVSLLSEKECKNFLTRIAKGEKHINLKLLKRLQEFSSNNKTDSDYIQRRTINEILELANNISEQMKEQERLKKEENIRIKMDGIAKDESIFWNKVFSLIETKQTKSYDEAVKILLELQDLSIYYKKNDQFQLKISQIYKKYKNLPGLKSRLNSAGLSG